MKKADANNVDATIEDSPTHELASEIDVSIRELVAEVDVTLIRESLARSPFQRVRAANQKLRAVRGFRRVSASPGG